MQRLPHVPWSSHVLLATQQQSRNIDARKHVAEVGFGECPHRDPGGGRMELRDHRRQLVDHVRSRLLRDEHSMQGWCPPIGRQLRISQHRLEPLLDDLGGKRPGPARIRRRKDQCAENRRMPTVQL